MKRRLLLALATSLSLGACQGTVSGTAADRLISNRSPIAAAHPSSILPAVIAGNVIAAGAGNIIAAGSGNIIAAGSGNVIAAGAGNVIAAGAGNITGAGSHNYSVADATVLAGAEVFLADADGNPLPKVAHVLTDAKGAYRFENMPAGFTFKVVVRVQTAKGAQGQLVTVAHTGAEASGADVSAATTLVSAVAAKGQNGMLGDFDKAVFAKVVQNTTQAMAGATPPDWSDATAVSGKMTALAAASPDLGATIGQLKQALAKPSMTLQQLEDAIDTLNPPTATQINLAHGGSAQASSKPASASPGASSTGTPSASPSSTPSASPSPSPSPSASPTAPPILLKVARYDATVEQIGQFAYVIGGGASETDTSTILPVERATLGTNGPVSFMDSGVKLNSYRAGHSSAVIDNKYLYIFGGGPLGCERAAIAGNGDLQAFQPLTGVTTLSRRAYQSMAVIGRHVYLFGGFDLDAHQPLNDVVVASIDASSNVSDFKPAQNAQSQPITLAVATTQATAYVRATTHFVYVIGGSQGTVQRAPVDANGVITGSFTPMAGEFTASSPYAHSLVYTPHAVYLLGGGGTETSVLKASVDANGDLPSTAQFLSVPGSALSQPRTDAAAFLLNGSSSAFLLGGQVTPFGTAVDQMVRIDLQ